MFLKKLEVNLKLQHGISKSKSSSRYLENANSQNVFIWRYLYGIAEAVIERRSMKKMFLKISQNLQENNCAEVILVTLQVRDLHLYKIETPTQVFSNEFAGVFRALILYNDYHMLYKVRVLKNHGEVHVNGCLWYY